MGILDAAAGGVHSRFGGAEAKPVGVERRDRDESGPSHPDNLSSVSRPIPLQTRKSRLASAAGKQDDSGAHRATAANGNQGVSVARLFCWQGREGGKKR